MLTFIKGMALGGALVSAGLVGYAYGQGGDDEAVDPAQKAGANCQVRVGYPQYSGSYRCMFDQVMVGQQNNLILCADVEVTCL